MTTERKKMKIYCITDDQELEVGLKLAGCEAITLNNNDEIEKKINEVTKNTDIGILVINKGIYDKLKDKIDKIRFTTKLPLITII